MDEASQKDKLAALGKLSAGLAHELNNPAAAARRAAHTLRTTLPALQTQTLKLNALGLTDEQVWALIAFQQRVIEQAAAVPLPALEQSAREDEIGAWFAAQGLANGEERSAAFVTAGVTPGDLAALVGQVPPRHLAAIVAWLHEMLEAAVLLDEIEQSAQRISELVGAVKSYTYMDQAQAPVDLHQGLESTLTVMRHKLRNVEVVRQYDLDLPMIRARGGELTQVWTNLIDNAVDAMQGQGRLALTTRGEEGFVTVEVTDTGPGIPPEIMPRLFEPFFTTKAVGVGTGLGLDTSYRIIQQHRGTIEVQSRPGHTRFTVRLPINAGEE